MKKAIVVRPESPPSKWQRRYFYFTAAMTGAAILIVEILGAKMLAPFVGTSQIVLPPRRSGRKVKRLNHERPALSN